MLSARMRVVSETRPDHLSDRSKSGSFLRETVTGAIERLDSVKFGIDLTELAPHALYVAVDGAVVDIDIVLIGRVHQLIASLHHAGALRQRLKDQELGHRQRDVVAAPGPAM